MAAFFLGGGEVAEAGAGRGRSLEDHPSLSESQTNVGALMFVYDSEVGSAGSLQAMLDVSLLRLLSSL